MSNILYIGPYRQYDYNGIRSKIYLDSIRSSVAKTQRNFYSRPLFLNSAVIDNSAYECEILPPMLDKYEAIIQHCPIEYFYIQKKFRNIFIPILDAKINKYSSYSVCQKINSADAVIVANHNQKTQLVKSGITTNIIISDENLVEYIPEYQRQQRYDFGPLYNNMYHFGFIGPYTDNIQIIQKIIVAFLVAFRSHNKYRLVLFLRGTANDKNEIEAFYKDILSKLKIIEYPYISFIFNNLDLEASIASLNSMDCLLSLNDDTFINLYESYMSKENKYSINKYNIDNMIAPVLSADTNYDIEDNLSLISTGSLIESFVSVADNKPLIKKVNNPNKIGETICQILR